MSPFYLFLYLISPLSPLRYLTIPPSHYTKQNTYFNSSTSTTFNMGCVWSCIRERKKKRAEGEAIQLQISDPIPIGRTEINGGGLDALRLDRPQITFNRPEDIYGRVTTGPTPAQQEANQANPRADLPTLAESKEKDEADGDGDGADDSPKLI
ncbi:uncharacterized protein FTOL_02076 [Fusarium torulosum]|uniref:Uncharacterized protein n=1 Tax=Fusarium torulosum TaxID=33205 RepID=A0AAE8M1I2_9HYPO|nr:uncharacterized protein FTOL_02076 [Fusarium torulosum]